MPWLLALLLLLPGVDLRADPAPAAGSRTSKTKKARKIKKARRKKARKTKKARRKKVRRKRRKHVKKRRASGGRQERARRKRRRRARRVARVSATRCKDIFCTSRVLALEGKGSSFKQLSSAQVERVMFRSVARLEPCLVQERRKNPHLRGATIEFVVSKKGRVLASRIEKRGRVKLSSCLQKAMRSIQFPRVTGRTVATFTINVPR